MAHFLITPIDGRYHTKTSELTIYFSEAALIDARLKVESEYFSFLLKTIKVHENVNIKVDQPDRYKKIKEIEKVTNHDVKAVEMYMADLVVKKYGKKLCLNNFVHFGLTSADVNSASYSLLLNAFRKNYILPKLKQLSNAFKQFGEINKHVYCLGKTHGQPATPIRFGDQFLIFASRLDYQISKMENIELYCKFGGATGGLNAHCLAFPNIDWISEMDSFVNSLGLKRKRYTTQVDDNDQIAELFDCLKRISTILLDACVDIWLYISNGYLKQKSIDSEVGSSTMPHKVNPIDFENAEGNLKLATSQFEILARTLCCSRMQRDLSNSTVMRNFGTSIAYLVIAIKSIEKGLTKISVNEKLMKKDLEENYSIVAEGIQTLLRLWKISDPYDKLKQLTRNTNVTKSTIDNWVDQQKELSKEQKDLLKNITPFNYKPI